MKTIQFRLRKLDVDDYDAPHVEVSISGGGFSARQDSYIEDEEWLDMAELAGRATGEDHLTCRPYPIADALSDGQLGWAQDAGDGLMAVR